jgi:hypothetical protein
MLLTLTYSGGSATDLGYLLHKSPFRVHSFEQVFGKAQVFYPEATPERCTAALLLEIDPNVALPLCYWRLTQSALSAIGVGQAAKATLWSSMLTTVLTRRHPS